MIIAIGIVLALAALISLFVIRGKWEHEANDNPAGEAIGAAIQCAKTE